MTLSARHGTHGPSRLTFLENENARLRASNAELLAALKPFAEVEPGYIRIAPECFERARAAINKAEGYE